MALVRPGAPATTPRRQHCFSGEAEQLAQRMVMRVTGIRLAAVAVLLLLSPLAAAAQPATKIPRLGQLLFGTSGSDPAAIEGLRQGSSQGCRGGC